MTVDDVPTPLWRSPAVVAGVAATGLLFAAGGMVGAVFGSLERGGVSPLGLAFLIAAAAMLVGCGALLRRTVPKLFSGASPSVTRSRRLLILSALLGAAIGVFLVLGSLASGEEPPAIFGNQPIPDWIALATIAAWLLVVPPLTWKWHRSIDEHEASAYRDGTLAGMYAYCAIAPTWWFGWRGGFLPEPQEMVTFTVVLAVWGLVWAVRRYG